MSIPLIDLKAQFKPLEEEIIQAVREVLNSGQYILGPQVRALEEEIAAYCGVGYGVGVANGTDALLLTLLAYGIGPGHEVITTPYTFFATAEVISRVGATPVFVDIDPATYNINPQLIEERITPRTRGIMPVHLFGQTADMDSIMALAEKYHLVVIEDACQAIGARYKGRQAGSLAHAACFSFFPTKNLGGYGDGGMVVTNDGDIADKIRLLRAHGSTRKYIHSAVGLNSRLDEVQAAILRIKLKYLDSWNQSRREKADLYGRYLAGVDGITPPLVAEGNEAIYHLYIIRCRDRERVMARLQDARVACAVYYPVPLHLQEVYRELGYRPGDLPAAEEASRETLALPLYPDLAPEAVQDIAGLVREGAGNH